MDKETEQEVRAFFCKNAVKISENEDNDRNISVWKDGDGYHIARAFREEGMVLVRIDRENLTAEQVITYLMEKYMGRSNKQALRG